MSIVPFIMQMGKLTCTKRHSGVTRGSGGFLTWGGVPYPFGVGFATRYETVGGRVGATVL